MAARQLTPKLDAVAAAAVDLARRAAEEVAGPGEVGEHLGTTVEAERMVVHRFSTTHRGYVGWAWTVVVVRVPRARVATVSEVVLLPGEGALLPPAWLPWSDRVIPGDLGETDVLAFREDDPLLDEGYENVGDADVADGDEAFDDVDAALVWELGLGRKRVVNREGRIEAATRWYAGDQGPDNAVTRASDASCASCAYLVGITGSLRQAFGVCANAWSPDDGRAVSLDHGCGAHSETGPTTQEPEPLPEPLVDDLRQELDTEPGPPDAAPAPSAPDPGPGTAPSEPDAAPSVAPPSVVPEPDAAPSVAPEPAVVPEPSVEPEPDAAPSEPVDLEPADLDTDEVEPAEVEPADDTSEIAESSDR